MRVHIRNIGTVNVEPTTDRLRPIFELCSQRKNISFENFQLKFNGRIIENNQYFDRTFAEEGINTDGAIIEFEVINKPLLTLSVDVVPDENNQLSSSKLDFHYSATPNNENEDYFLSSIFSDKFTIHNIQTIRYNWQENIRCDDDHGMNFPIANKYDREWIQLLPKTRFGKDIAHIQQYIDTQKSTSNISIKSVQFSFGERGGEIEFVRVVPCLPSKYREVLRNVCRVGSELSVKVRRNIKPQCFTLPSDIWRNIAEYAAPISCLSLTLQCDKNYPLTSCSIKVSISGDVTLGMKLIYRTWSQIVRYYKVSGHTMMRFIELLSTIEHPQQPLPF